jgi:hypothetical protein
VTQNVYGFPPILVSSVRGARVGLGSILGEKESGVLGITFYSESQKRAALSDPTNYRLLLASAFQPEAANDVLFAIVEA